MDIQTVDAGASPSMLEHHRRCLWLAHAISHSFLPLLSLCFLLTLVEWQEVIVAAPAVPLGLL
jgi:hypothetical protein